MHRLLGCAEFMLALLLLGDLVAGMGGQRPDEMRAMGGHGRTASGRDAQHVRTAADAVRAMGGHVRHPALSCWDLVELRFVLGRLGHYGTMAIFSFPHAPFLVRMA